MANVNEIRKLVEERKALMGRLESLSRRELTPEEQAAWDELTAKVAELDAKVMAIEEELGMMAEEEATEEAPPEAPPAEEPPVEEQNSRILEEMKTRLKLLEGKVTRRTRPLHPSAGPRFTRDLDDKRLHRDRDLCFRGWTLYGTDRLTDEHRSAAERMNFNLGSRSMTVRLWNDMERRAQSTSTTAGGYLIPTGFLPELEKALAYFCNLRDIGRVLRTDSGNPLQIPTVDDTAQVGERVNENSQYNAQDVTFGQKTMNAYLYNSKIVLCSIQLMQDSAIDVASMLGGLLGERLGRIQSTEFTTSDGSSKPEGVAYAAAAGVSAASASAIALDDILGLLHSVDRAYRDSARFCMSDAILLVLRKLKDGEGRPIFTESYMVGEPDRLLGYPVTILNAMDTTISSTKRTILFGDFSKFFIRDAMDLQIVRMDERYADYGQVGFVGLLRSDSKLIQTAAVKRLTH